MKFNQVSVDFLRVVQFNALKCVVLKLRETLSYIYTLNGHDLNQVHEQRDFFVCCLAHRGSTVGFLLL